MNFVPFKPKTVLGVMAHPDDLDFMCGGTIAAFARNGADVYYLILTDGGSAESEMSQAKLIATRRKEQRAACKTLGVKDVFFCDYPDGCLENCREVRCDIVKRIRMLKPDAVITWDPSVLYSAREGYINHPDHRAVGQATLDAVYPLARDLQSFSELKEEGYLPHKTPTVLLLNFNTHNFCVDITDTFDLKMQAAAAHVSQASNAAQLRQRFTELAIATGHECGSRYAESFVRIDVRIS